MSESIRAPGFPMMGLPTELRLEILSYLLIDPDIITLSDEEGEDDKTTLPSVSILRTCKRINEEGTPLLYTQNQFSIYFEHDAKTFFLSQLRWPTYSLLQPLTITSSDFTASFTCTSAQILEHLTPRAHWFMSQGPNFVLDMSLRNWVLLKLAQSHTDAITEGARRPLSLPSLAS
ncbi:hypothetical protein B7494_g6512 [Chlorociboria aeruginascens]|nr:hypothetical protein B7494_g6512 [Chlorociboria aeruginascens]